MKEIELHVTHADIDEGRRRAKFKVSPYYCNCPIAIAGAKLFKKKMRFNGRYLTDSDNRINIRVPDLAWDWAGAFDSGLPISPFSFHIYISDDIPTYL